MSAPNAVPITFAVPVEAPVAPVELRGSRKSATGKSVSSKVSKAAKNCRTKCRTGCAVSNWSLNFIRVAHGLACTGILVIIASIALLILNLIRGHMTVRLLILEIVQMLAIAASYFLYRRVAAGTTRALGLNSISQNEKIWLFVYYAAALIVSFYLLPMSSVVVIMENIFTFNPHRWYNGLSGHVSKSHSQLLAGEEHGFSHAAVVMIKIVSIIRAVAMILFDALLLALLVFVAVLLFNVIRKFWLERSIKEDSTA